MVMLRKGAVKAGPISLIFDIARFEGVQMTIFFFVAVEKPRFKHCHTPYSQMADTREKTGA